jgi:hypothetical protein
LPDVVHWCKNGSNEIDNDGTKEQVKKNERKKTEVCVCEYKQMISIIRKKN